MNDFIIAIGHTSSGNIGCGAADNLDESNCTRQVGPLVVKYLENAGKKAPLLRIDKGNEFNCEDCYTRANQANYLGAEWYIEIHFNSGKEHTGDGAEVCISSTNSEVENMASKVSEKVSVALGIENRGVKRENLIVLKRTFMKAILVECMFVDGDNPNRYNADVIARAIVEGLLGTTVSIKPKLGWNQSADGLKWWYCTDVDKYYYHASCWQLIGGFWYLFDASGWCITGWKEYITIKDKIKHWYYLDPTSCQMSVGWKKVINDWYYFNKDGEMQTGWIKDDKGNDYYLYSTGEMATNIDYIGYHFDKDGNPTKLQ